MSRCPLPFIVATLLMLCVLADGAVTQHMSIAVVNYDQWTNGDRVAMLWALNQSRPALLTQGWDASLHIFGCGIQYAFVGVTLLFMAGIRQAWNFGLQPRMLLKPQT